MKLHPLVTFALSVSALATSAPAAFHVMQIEQVIGGINGDVTAQAIQRGRESGAAD